MKQHSEMKQNNEKVVVASEWFLYYIGIQFSWKKQHESNIVCFLCIYVISGVHVWRRALLKTKNAASGSVVALPAYTHTNAHSHTRKTVLLAPYLGVSDNPMMLFTVWQPWNWCEVWWEGTAADSFWIQSYSAPMMAETHNKATQWGICFLRKWE